MGVAVVEAVALMASLEKMVTQEVVVVTTVVEDNLEKVVKSTKLGWLQVAQWRDQTDGLNTQHLVGKSIIIILPRMRPSGTRLRTGLSDAIHRDLRPFSLSRVA